MPSRPTSRRRLLAGLALLPAAVACRQQFPDPPKAAAPAAALLATPTPDEPRKVRIALPSHDLFRFWATRFQNVNNRLDPARRVKLTTTPIDVGTTGSEELPAVYAQAIAALPSAEAPDLFMTGPEEISLLPALARGGVALDLNPVLKSERWFKMDDFWGNALRAGQVQGKQAALPISLGAEVILFNRKNFQELGVQPPEGAWTWEQLIATAKRLSRRGAGDQPGRWGLYVGPGSPSLLTLAWQHGAQVISDDGGHVDMTEPGTLRALELLVDLIDTHKVAPPLDEPAVAAGFGRPWAAMRRGEIAMWSVFAGGAVWWVGGGTDDLRIAEMPTAEKKVTLGTTPLMLGVPRNAPDQAHSLNALRAILDASAESMFLPPTRNASDIRKTDNLMAETDATAFANTLPMLRFIPGDAPTNVGPAVEHELLRPVLLKQKRPQQAARDTQRVIDALLKKAQG
ncbi:MAG TPA: extracellular solute-binding protein [Chloroflexota bacterium]|nr:extracellular solute-binding protein [Chloroflexota bacterium]